MTDIRQLGNVLASALAESDEPTPEGMLYAALMCNGCDIHSFQAAVSLLLAAGLVERLPGPQLRATTKLREMCREHDAWVAQLAQKKGAA